jgi:hypothetical protein
MTIDQIKARFQSGNSVPVDKAMLPKAEFDYLIERIEQLEATNINAANRVIELTKEVMELRKQLSEQALQKLSDFSQEHGL